MEGKEDGRVEGNALFMDAEAYRNIRPRSGEFPFGVTTLREPVFPPDDICPVQSGAMEDVRI